MLIYEQQGPSCNSDLHVLVQNFTVDNCFLDYRKPEAGDTSPQGVSLHKTSDNAFTSPQTVVRLFWKSQHNWPGLHTFPGRLLELIIFIINDY